MKICILGSTGSIGTQTLDVIRNLKKTVDIEVIALTTNKRIEIMQEQINEFRPKYVAVGNEEAGAILKKNVASGTEVLVGLNGIREIATLPEADTIVNALVGNVGLIPTMDAIDQKKNIALANKETLVTAGELVMKAAASNGVWVHPIDSEHSAIFQCMHGNESNRAERLYITASGGPFREKTYEELSKVTVEQALNHPKWKMGSKITVDSSTLMNKGLEVIEAHWLFDMPLEKIEVLVHPQCVVHSMVEFEDGAIIAQLGEADMHLPIQYALMYPKRYKNNFKRLNFLENPTLTFEQPNLEKFPCLSLAYKAIKIGGALPAVMNGANEVLVSKFLSNEIKFLDIPILIEKAMNAYTVKTYFNLDDVIAADKFGRNFVTNELNVKLK